MQCFVQATARHVNDCQGEMLQAFDGILLIHALTDYRGVLGRPEPPWVEDLWLSLPLEIDFTFSASNHARKFEPIG